MADDGPDYFGAVKELGGAVGDLFGMFGSQQASSAYDKAANIAEQNKALTLRSTAIQEQQATQQTFKTIGAEQADVAGAGFSQGGSAGDLLRSSAQQAALSKQLLENQGQVTAQGYEQQAQAYEGQKEAAQTKAAGQGIGGLFGIGLSIASLFA